MREFEWVIIRGLLISLFLKKKENRCYLQNFSVFLEKVFSVYTTPLPRRDASSIHFRLKKTQTNLYVFFVRSFSGIFCLLFTDLQNAYIISQLVL